MTCAVTIHGSVEHGSWAFAGLPMYRAYAEGCLQRGEYRETIAYAEVDAQRMDGHDCIHEEPGKESWMRALPKDRIRHITRALHDPETALRYLPYNQ